MKIFTLLYTTWLRNGMHLRYLPMQRRCYQKFLRQNLQTLGELQLEKKVIWTKSFTMWGRKEPKTARSPCGGKREVREPKRRSQQLFASWNWRSSCLRSGCLLSARGDYDHPPANPPTGKDVASAPEPKPKPNPAAKSSVNGLKFVQIIYLQPCQTRSWSNVLSALQCFTACGELLGHCPTTH